MLIATVACAGVSRTIRVRDMSAQGACVEGETLPQNGSHLLFARNGLLKRARVAWVRRQHCGLEFAETLDVQDALRVVTSHKGGSARAPGRPGLKPRKLTDAERLVMERWAASSPAVGD